MPDNCFLDSNILVYAFDNSSSKQDKAIKLWKQGVTISTQVLMEVTNVCIKKLRFGQEVAYENAQLMMASATIKSVTKESIRSAFEISTKYKLNHWDSLIVASALESGCKILYTEDLHHSLLINNRLKVINPFL